MLPELPAEIWTKVFWQLRQDFGLAALAPTILVSKKWHQTSLPCLYRHLRLDDRNLARFVDGPADKARDTALAHVQCLSIQLRSQQSQSDEHRDRIMQDGNHATHRLWANLRSLRVALRSMPNLSVFSIYQDKYADSAMGYWIPHDCLILILQSLPLSCIHLEVDCYGMDRADMRRGHLCDTIRSLLPRLESLRLCLSTLCAGLFLARYRFQEQVDPGYLQLLAKEAGPVLSLRSVIINCSPNWHTGSVVCACMHKYAGNVVPSASLSRISMVQILRQLYLTGMLPAIETCLLMDSQTDASRYDDGQDYSGNEIVHKAFNRRDVIGGLT
jgi:hypothetical protein